MDLNHSTAKTKSIHKRTFYLAKPLVPIVPSFLSLLRFPITEHGGSLLYFVFRADAIEPVRTYLVYEIIERITKSKKRFEQNELDTVHTVILQIVAFSLFIPRSYIQHNKHIFVLIICRYIYIYSCCALTGTTYRHNLIWFSLTVCTRHSHAIYTFLCSKYYQYHMFICFNMLIIYLNHSVKNALKNHSKKVKTV